MITIFTQNVQEKAAEQNRRVKLPVTTDRLDYMDAEWRLATWRDRVLAVRGTVKLMYVSLFLQMFGRNEHTQCPHCSRLNCLIQVGNL